MTILEQYCIINGIDYHSWKQVDTIIQRYASSKKFLTRHRQGYVLDTYARYLRGEIHQEEFLLVGDVNSKEKILTYQYRHPFQLSSVMKLWEALVEGFVSPYEEKICIVESLAWEYFLAHQGDNEQLLTLCDEYGIILHVLT